MQCWLAEYQIGLRSLPYLADHGFHDMAVLPGAFHIELARRLHREVFERDAVSLREIEFTNPIVLSADDAPLTVRIEKRTDGWVSYELFEATSEIVERSPGLQPSARLQVEFEPPLSSGKVTADEFAGHKRLTGNADELYSQLGNNGNQYGPHFQMLAGVWRSGAQVAGRFADALLNGDGSLPPPLLDAASQLLSGITLDRGKTFILKSISRLLLGVTSGSRPCWAYGTATNFENDGLVGSVRVVAADGTFLWELTGVTLAFMDRPRSEEPASREATRLCVSSTFTAEPLEDSLRFWGGHFGQTVEIGFAPYNQVFQQLLDPVSDFRRNRDGINLLVLGLEDWLHEAQPALRPDPAHVSACFETKPRRMLPNGLEVAHLNRHETDYLYQEIFEDQSYLRHDIQFADGDTVVDIGANIGLFSLFVLSRCENPEIFAYEPSPRVFDL
ncbi:MAG: polyketide synthase dehydratase domain-containing protein, partial [Chthoniobacterales bacterium]